MHTRLRFAFHFHKQPEIFCSGVIPLVVVIM